MVPILAPLIYNIGMRVVSINTITPINPLLILLKLDPIIKNHFKSLEEAGVFVDWYNDPMLKKKIKEFDPELLENKLHSVIRIKANALIDNYNYELTFKSDGPLADYFTAISKKKIKNYLLETRLIFVKLERCFDDESEILIDLGMQHVGKVIDSIS